MDYAIFAQCFGRIRAMETKLLGKSKIGTMVEAADYSDCIRLLQDTKYGQYLSTPSYEEWLRSAIEDLYAQMYKIVPVRDVVDILAVKYDIHNIKSLIKGRISGSDVSKMLIDAGTMHRDKLYEIFAEKDLKGMPETLKYSSGKAFEDYKISENPQDIDIEMDRGMFKYMNETADKSRMDFLIDFVKFTIDTTNIKTFIRIKAQEKNMETLQKALIPGGKLGIGIFEELLSEPIDKFSEKLLYTEYCKWAGQSLGELMRSGDISSIEKFGDNSILEYVKKAKLASMGPEPVVAYIVACENEIKILRIILTGKRNLVSPESIMERLRDTYV